MRTKLGIVLESLARGGAERVSIYLAEYFRKRGWECDFITLTKADNEYQLPDGINRFIAYTAKPNAVFAIKKIREKIRESNPDIVLIMETSLCTYTVSALAGLRMPFVVSERNDPGHFAGNRLNIKIARFLMKKANGFVFQTKGAKEFYDKPLKGRGTIIPNPLNGKISGIYMEQREKKIVAVGRLVEQKNQKLLINAFAGIHKKYIDYFLDIYGEGELENELRQLCAKLGIGKFVRFHGNVTDVVEQIKNAAVFVMPSYYEGMPNALIEAMSVGMPCIATDCPCGGPHELIDNNVNGILVKVDNVEEMERAIGYYLEHPDIAAKHGEKALEIRKKLNPDVIGDKWVGYFEKILMESI